METTSTYTFVWGRKACSGKSDPMHTIRNLDAGPYLDYWISTMRAGTPWQLMDNAGRIVREGIA